MSELEIREKLAEKVVTALQNEQAEEQKLARQKELMENMQQRLDAHNAYDTEEASYLRANKVEHLR